MSTEMPLCPSCARPVPETASACPLCGQPLSPRATTDPMGILEAQGAMVRKAMEKPSAFVVTGMWMLFGLPLMAWVFFAYLLVVDEDAGLIDKLIGLGLLAFLAWLYWSIL